MKGVIKGLIIGGVIAAIGIVVILITLGVNGCEFKDRKYVMETFTAESDNTAIELSIGAGTLVTEFYDGDKVEIEYPASDGLKTSVTEADGEVKYYSSPKWNKMFFGGLEKIPKTTVKLPKNVTFKLKLDMNAGSVQLASGMYKEVELDMSAGTVNADYIECTALKCDMSAGTVKIGESVCNTSEFDMSAGTIIVNRLTSAATDVDISAGTVKLSLTGDKAEYSILTDVSAGSCNVSAQTGNTEKRIKVDVSAGSATLSFNA